MSNIDEPTQQAYRETHFKVFGSTPMTLRVGVHNSELLQLYEIQHVQSCAFITSCNPHGQLWDDAANAARQVTLEMELKQEGLAFIAGIGQHPSNDWPGEASVLVLDLSQEDAKAWGAKHEQNAIVWCGADAVPQLVLLR